MTIIILNKDAVLDLSLKFIFKIYALEELCLQTFFNMNWNGLVKHTKFKQFPNIQEGASSGSWCPGLRETLEWSDGAVLRPSTPTWIVIFGSFAPDSWNQVTNPWGLKNFL